MTYVIDFGGTSMCRTESLIQSEIPQRLTTYDAAYLELAIRRRVPLATKDKALIRAADAAKVQALPGRLGDAWHAH